MAEELENARIDQLPLGEPGPGDYGVYRDMVEAVTKKFLLDPFLPGETVPQTFEWVTGNDPGYVEDAVVTYGGKWWQSQIDNNLDNVPGVDITKWVEISKSFSWAFWQAGVYTDSKVVVMRRIANEIYLFELNEAVSRPYVSANFNTELEDGDWIQFGVLDIMPVDSSGSTITLNMLLLKQLMFNFSDPIDEAKSWMFVNDVHARFIPSIRFTISALEPQTFEEKVKMDNGQWDPGLFQWTPTVIGDFEMTGTYDGVFWYLKIAGPFASVSDGIFDDTFDETFE